MVEELELIIQGRNKLEALMNLHQYIIDNYGNYKLLFHLKVIVPLRLTEDNKWYTKFRIKQDTSLEKDL